MKILKWLCFVGTAFVLPASCSSTDNGDDLGASGASGLAGEVGLEAGTSGSATAGASGGSNGNEAGRSFGGSTGASAGGSSGSGKVRVSVSGAAGAAGAAGAPSQGLCTCEQDVDGDLSDCVIDLENFCPVTPVAGCPLKLDRLRQIENLCAFDAENGTYSECDDMTVRFAWQEGGENDYALVFDTESSELLYGYASNYVAFLCQSPNIGDSISVTAGTAPASATCRSCRFCQVLDEPGAGGAAGASAAAERSCVLDADGRVGFPD